MHLVSSTNTHHDVTDLVNHGMIENIKTWISWKRNIIFVRNKKMRNNCFVAEVTFKFFTIKFNYVWINMVRYIQKRISFRFASNFALRKINLTCFLKIFCWSSSKKIVDIIYSDNYMEIFLLFLRGTACCCCTFWCCVFW